MSPSYTTSPTVQPSNDSSLNAILPSSQHLNGRPHPLPTQPTQPIQPMDGRQQDYSQSGLSSPYTHYPDSHSEGRSADPASSAQYQQDVKFTPDVSSSSLSHSTTPSSEYALAQQSARNSGSFPEYIAQQRSAYADGAQRYQQPAAHASHAGMAQASSPSVPMPNGTVNGNAPRDPNSDSALAIDPSIAASSPTYPPQQHQYSPYPPQHEMQQYGQPGAPIGYAPRPEWAGHYGPPMYAHAPVSAGGGPPGMVAQVARPPPVYTVYPGQPPMYHADPSRQGGHPLSTVYSFVPIPGAQQHKRPRRRYEEIERMYKCGWNGCEKAYGTLNHLNAHVTMQSHGTKRTPEGTIISSLQLFGASIRNCKHLTRFAFSSPEVTCGRGAICLVLTPTVWSVLVAEASTQPSMPSLLVQCTNGSTKQRIGDIG